MWHGVASDPVLDVHYTSFQLQAFQIAPRRKRQPVS